MLTDAESKLVVTQASLLPVVLEAASLANLPKDRILLLGSEKNNDFAHFTSVCDSNGSTKSTRPRLDPDKNLAFLAYSSGTTGLPKGVMLSHTNIISDVLMISGSVGRYYNFKDDKLLGVLPFFHIYGTSSLSGYSLLSCHFLLTSRRSHWSRTSTFIPWNRSRCHALFQAGRFLPHCPGSQNHFWLHSTASTGTIVT